MVTQLQIRCLWIGMVFFREGTCVAQTFLHVSSGRTYNYEAGDEITLMMDGIKTTGVIALQVTIYTNHGSKNQQVKKFTRQLKQPKDIIEIGSIIWE